MEADRLTRLYSILTEIERIVDEPWMQGGLRQAYRQRLEAIRTRLMDPNLYLALIGEFNAGKSTFINRLTGMNLLKTAHRATTSMPTRIRTDARLLMPRLVVTTYAGEQAHLFTTETIQAFAKRHGRQLPGTLTECIAEITTGEAWTDLVREAEVLLPNRILDGRVVLIDTPGVNATGDENAMHASRTEQVLRHEADAALLLVKGSSSMLSRSLTDFLMDTAPHVMSNAMVVVNGMDQVEEEDREDVLRFVRKTAQRAFGTVQEIPVMGCSALKAGRDVEWSIAFEDAQAQIQDYLRKSRVRIVSERLSELMRMLIEDIIKAGQTSQEELSRQKQALEKNSLQAFETVLDRAKSEIRTCRESMISVLLSMLDARMRKADEEAGKQVSAKLEPMTDRYSIIQFAKDDKQLGAMLEPAAMGMQQITQELVSSLSSGCRSITRQYVERIRQGCIEIRAQGFEDPDAGRHAGEMADVRLSEIIREDQQIMIRNRRVDWASLAGGALAGGAVAGPIGAIVGAIGLMVAGDRLFVQETKKEAYAAIMAGVHQYFFDCVGMLGGYAANEAFRLEREAAAFCEDCKNRYGRTYERVYQEMEIRKRSLAAQETQIRKSIRCLNDLLARLES